MKASDRGRNIKSKELFGCFDEIAYVHFITVYCFIPRLTLFLYNSIYMTISFSNGLVLKNEICCHFAKLTSPISSAHKCIIFLNAIQNITNQSIV